MADRALADLIAKKFIQRTDVKAAQRPDGSYVPWEVDAHGSYCPAHRGGQREPWKRDDLNAHLDGAKSFGHYLLGTDGKCKLFAFDIDLEKTGYLPTRPLDPWFSDEELLDYEASFDPCNPREAWRNRRHPGRSFMKYQFKLIAHQLMAAVRTELDLPTACAYSGAKGVHVYAFTGPISASDAFDGAMIVIDSLGCFEPKRGNVFFQHKDHTPVHGFPNLSIEVFPKQRTLEGKDLGNLMRLPLGRNLKTNDPTFFVDMTSPLGEMQSVDPLFALTTSDPFARPSEVA